MLFVPERVVPGLKLLNLVANHRPRAAPVPNRVHRGSLKAYSMQALTGREKLHHGNRLGNFVAHFQNHDSQCALDVTWLMRML